MFRSKKAYPPKLQTFAICGVDHGLGATHLSFALANYLCSKCRYRTAYVEMNGQDELLNLSDRSDDTSFRYMEVDMYPTALWEDLPHIMRGGYERIVIDMGVLDEQNRFSFLRADRPLLIGSASPWKRPQLEHALTMLDAGTPAGRDAITVLGNNGINTKLPIAMTPIPSIPNPFQLVTATWTFFEGLLKGS